jgi:hypothetical protein
LIRETTPSPSDLGGVRGRRGVESLLGLPASYDASIAVPLRVRTFHPIGFGGLRRPNSMSPVSLPDDRDTPTLATTGHTRREPPASPRRRLAAPRGLHLSSVDHPPAPVRLGDESRAWLAGLGHRAHGARVDRVEPRALVRL